MNLRIRPDFSACEDRTVLILSDAFPPYAAGGAEISLNASLDALTEKKRQQIVLLAFADITEFELSNYKGALIIHAPMVAAWPYEDKFLNEFHHWRQNSRIGERNLARLIRLRKSLLGPNQSAARQAYTESSSKPAGGIMTDHLLGDTDLRIEIAKKVISSMRRLDLLVADNTRSILIGALVKNGIQPAPRSVAIIRDNRFHCARPSQSRMVKGKLCRKCDFRCAVEDIKSEDRSSSAMDTRKRALKATDDFREKALQTYNHVVVTSHELMRHVSPRLKSSQQIVRIPNSIGSLQQIDQITSSVAQNSEPRILIIGMLNENKGQLHFVKTAKQWLKNNPEIRLVLAGRGKRIEDAIRKVAKNSGLEKQIMLIGYRSRAEIFEEIAKSRLVVAPTVWPEPFGRVPIEAAAAGKAIIAFARGGLCESIIHGKTGILIEPGNYEAMLEAIEALLDDPMRRTAMESAARAWVTEAYAPARTTDVFAKSVFSDHADSGLS